MQLVQEPPHQALEAARAAVQAGAWADALRLAGSVLARDPLYAGAFEVISLARRALEQSREGSAERRQMTILFADVAGSTSLLAQLGSEAYRDLVLELHEAAAKAMSSFGGRIGQFLGDGILAYFSYPEAHEDDAQRAVYAGLDLLARLERAAPALAKRFGSKPALRLGIDTGRVVIGAAGAGQWTTVDSVFGDPAHVAARLQALAPVNSIFISDATRKLVERHFVLEPVGQQALAGYAAPVAVHRVVRASDGPHPDFPGPTLCDRESEVAELERLWASVRAGAREELALVGEAGVGKSRLVEHLANVVTATGGRVVAIHCSAAFQSSAFYPVTAAVRRVLLGSIRDGASDEELRAALVKAELPDELVSRAIEPLSSLLDVRRSVDMLPQQLRAAVFEVLLDLLGRLAAGTPLLLVFEDQHVADASTAELLKLIRERSTAPLLLLATQRPGAAVTPDFQRSLKLGPLPEPFARELVQRSAPQLDESKVNDVVSGSAGLPLFLIEMARSLSSGPSLLSGPSATTALLTHRLDLLDDDSRSLVSDLSVLGTACSYPLMAAVSELPTERLERALARLLHSELLVAIASSQGSIFQFRHPLYQELAYDRQLLAARKRRHARSADALIEQYERLEQGALPELVAHHLEHGDRTPESIGWWQRAGERAAASAAHSEAIAHFERGLKALPSLGATPERIQFELILQLSYGASCSAVYGYADTRSMQAYTRASEIGAAAPDATLLLPALWGIWAYYVVRGAHAQALELTTRCLTLADAAGSADVRAVAGGIGGAQFVYVGRWQDAEGELSLATHARGPMTQLFPQDPALSSRVLLALVKLLRGDEAAARGELETALAGAAALTGRQAEFTRAYVFCFAAWYAQVNDDSAQALGLAQQALAIAQRNNFETWLGAGALHIAGALTELGDFATGLPLFAQALSGWRNAGAELMLPYFFGRYGRAQVRAGQISEGIETLRQALSVARASGEVFYDAELHRFLAEALAESGADPETVLRERESAERIAGEQGALLFGRRASERR
jgi:class 3 adenylate cyclase/tetratricopeptide (TPR) repeat protein/energy-coupling factor transporter ATP-binding protein EcfA2